MLDIRLFRPPLGIAVLEQLDGLTYWEQAMLRSTGDAAVETPRGDTGETARGWARRMGRLGTESAFEVLARARALEAEGRSMVHLEIGEPDFATPAHIIDAALAAIAEGYTHYTPAGGIPAVREGIAAHYADRLGVDVSAGEVILTPGSKNILMFTAMAVVEEGDEVIVPDPAYPIYESIVRFIGGVPVPLPLREENGFCVDPDELRALVSPRTRMIVVNSPHNPTGGVIPEDVLAEVGRTAQEHDLLVLSDEIYSQIAYEAPVPSMLSIPGMKERTVLLDGLSKTYAMCGWRLGIGVAPSALIAQMEKLMINSSSCAAAFTQVAALEALRSPASPPAVREMVEQYRARRDLVVEGLNQIPGVSCRAPGGAFYAFANITGTGFDERELADRLLTEAGVAVLPGTAFGAMGRGYVRLSFAQAPEQLEEGVRRMGAFITGAARVPA
jgi:aspartate aminotransferase